jgi:hypothetical protein
MCISLRSRKEVKLMASLTFAADVQFTRQNSHYICFRAATHVQVIISARLKEMIDQGSLSECSLEELEEVRSLRELGFVIDAPARTDRSA